MSQNNDKIHGVVGYYTTVDGLLAAARRVRDAGIKRWDSYSPFPVHGIDGAMGIKPTILPWITLAMGLTGLAFGILLQWWTNAVAYVFLISGKPDWSLPANIPVVFECVIAFSAFTTFFVMLGLNKLPHLSNPLHRLGKFARVTGDRFAICIEASDPAFDAGRARELLQGEDSEGVEECPVDESTATLPAWFHGVAAIATCLTLVPLSLAFKARFATSEKPRIEVWPDMDSQRKVKAQAGFELFPDSRGMRPPVPGTVAVGELILDDHYQYGIEPGTPLPADLIETEQKPRWAPGFPAALTVDRELVDRGRQRYDIFCSVCHGVRGDGLGAVAMRAKAVEAAQWGWVDPKALVGITSTALTPSDLAAERADPEGTAGMTNGQMFHTIGHGVSTMRGYAAQIPAHDRWAIVAYVRALQRSQGARTNDAPDGTTFKPLPKVVQAALQPAGTSGDAASEGNR